MERLVNAYRKVPSPSNRAKLQAYMDRHMMAVSLCDADTVAFLRAHGFREA